jgi:hypothetical protein
MKNKRGPCYKIKLLKATRTDNFSETLVIADFYPAEINGFGKPINARNERRK